MNRELSGPTSSCGQHPAFAGRLSTGEQRVTFEATELSIRFDPTIRQATFKVDLARRVSVRVGGTIRT